MALAPGSLYRGTLGTSLATLATVPASTTWVITSIVMTNKTGVARTAQLLLDGFTFVPNRSLDPLSQYTWDGRAVLATAKAISGQAAAGSAIDVHISGLVIT